LRSSWSATSCCSPPSPLPPLDLLISAERAHELREILDGLEAKEADDGLRRSHVDAAAHRYVLAVIALDGHPTKARACVRTSTVRAPLVMTDYDGVPDAWQARRPSTTETWWLRDRTAALGIFKQEKLF